MPKSLLAAVAFATMLCGATFGLRVAAMTPAMPSALGLSGVSRSAPTPVAIVCGKGGCAPINVKRVWHPPRGFAARAAPLNMPGATPLPPQNPPANK